MENTKSCTKSRFETFKECFKYYKRKENDVDLSDVIDFSKNVETTSTIKQFKLDIPKQSPIAGLKQQSDWKAYEFQDFPGFVFITNPFTNGFQKYWIKRCLQSYPVKPSKTNIDAHAQVTEEDNIWDMGKDFIGNEKKSKSEKNLLDKLRWTTLGYNHNWDTKEYSKGNKCDFPDDLSYLSSFIAATVGYREYKTEAAIINYYNLDSTLSCHNDHSEFDHEAPLISVSFGQTAIFLLGGQEREDRPLAMYLRSGDIAIMFGPSRLYYHAVPKIISNDTDYVKYCLDSEETMLNCAPNAVSPINICKRCEKRKADTAESETVENEEFCMNIKPCKLCKVERVENRDRETNSNDKSETLAVSSINMNIFKVMQETDNEEWHAFEQYILKGRINMNVRQIFKPGECFDTKTEQTAVL